MLTVEPFRLAHAQQVSMTDAAQHEGLAATILDGRIVLAVIGSFYHDDGPVEVWAALSEAAKQRPIMLCRVGREVVMQLARKHGYIRARIKDAKSRRFAEHLGFVFHGDVGEIRIRR